MKRIVLILSLLQFQTVSLLAQGQALGSWRVHLPFLKTRVVAEAGDKIYCASERGMFYYNQQDNSVAPLSKISGLSELDVSTMRYDPESKVLVIAYLNANIDLIEQNKIINISDIKRKNMTGDKTIYGISIRNKMAYLSCGFGIVLLDLVKKEIKDTYIIGPNGSEITVYDIDFSGNYIFAATESGIFTADLNNPNLSNFQNWTLSSDNAITGDYNMIEEFNGTLFANYAKPNATAANSTDDILMFDGTSWVTSAISGWQDNTTKNFSFTSGANELIVTNGYSVSVYNSSYSQIRKIDNQDYSNPITRDALYDVAGQLWIADFEQGLMRMTPGGDYEFIYPEGPQSALVSAMSVVGSRLWITHATRSQNWANQYNPGHFAELYQNDWRSYNSKTVTGTPYNLETFYDNMSLAIDPGNSRHVFIGSKVNGVLEMLNEAPVMMYRDQNSTLQPGIGNPGEVQAVGMQFDSNSNLWVLNSLAAEPVNVKTPAGEWYSFSIPTISTAPLFGDLLVDSYGQKWANIIGNNASSGGNGLAVFDDKGTFDDVTDDESRFITTGVGSGNLPSASVRAIAEDLDQEIWLGTEKGVAVIYSPGSVLTSSNFDAQQILIKQDGINQYLLESEVVTAIAVDGANRKWIGTESGGLFLMSPDGTQQIANYNEQNSPLLSDQVLALTIDKQTGEVHIGTFRGVISLMGDAITGEGGCHDVLVYPNPVRENYDGPIAIRGLVPNGNVKITDVSGNLVYESTALGTQAIWYGKNFSGEKAHTGVYLVFSTDEEGKNTCVTKLLLIN